MIRAAAQTKIYDTIAKQVCALLGWSIQVHHAFLIKCGKQYLQEYIPRHPQDIDTLIQSHVFWKWWQTNWYQRDIQFLSIIGGSQHVLQLCYKELHDPRSLAKSIYPNGIVLSESYAKMIGDVIDKKEGV